MRQFTLYKGRTQIQLGQKIGGGGEGDIFAIPTQANYVAKIYCKAPDDRKVKKLLSMPSLTTEDLKKVAAWPVDLLLEGRSKVVGFVMPKIEDRKDIHELYSPKSRAVSFPEVDFRFIVHVCANIARAFSIVHDHGHVIGDINHGSVLVGNDGRVALIDCDSFQINAGASVFTCDVGIPLFTAPEMQGQSLRGFTRTMNHDRFGMAVMLFYLLCMGRHPFAGRYSGSGDMPIERAIKEFRFAYGQNRASFGMERPPGTPSLDVFGAAVGNLFEQAFSAKSEKGGRPDERAWIHELNELGSQLRNCSSAAWHHFSNEQKSCPWCLVESQTGLRLFGQKLTSTNATGMVNVKTLWETITKIQRPDPDPALPSELPWKLPPDTVMPDQSDKNIRVFIALIFAVVGVLAAFATKLFLLGLGGIAVATALWPRVPAQKRAEAKRAISVAKMEYDILLSRWRKEATQSAFNTKYSELETVKNSLVNLRNERSRELVKLNSNRESQQRYRFLDTFQISQASIKHVGASRTAMLASYGIETAADIDSRAIIKIPGFGPSITQNLLAWKQAHESRFRFNPNEPVDPREIQALDQKLEAVRQKLVPSLQKGPAILKLSVQEINASRTRLCPMLKKAWNELKIAEARDAAL